MRFKLTLQLQNSSQYRMLPINYQYELSATIYHILSRSSVDYSTWLHENGFQADNKRFKLFTFSHLIIPQYKVDPVNHRLILLCDTVEWYISFLPEQSTQKFIEGVFMNQSFQLGDKISSVSFNIKEVNIMPPLMYKQELHFMTLSPICITERKEDGRTNYLSPSESGYASGILTGLLARYKALHGKEYSGPLFYEFQPLTEPRSFLAKIKAHTSQQIFIRGYTYKFRIKLPETLMKILYEGGCGEKNSMGFGCLKCLS